MESPQRVAVINLPVRRHAAMSCNAPGLPVKRLYCSRYAFRGPFRERFGETVKASGGVSQSAQRLGSTGARYVALRLSFSSPAREISGPPHFFL